MPPGDAQAEWPERYHVAKHGSDDCSHYDWAQIGHTDISAIGNHAKLFRIHCGAGGTRTRQRVNDYNRLQVILTRWSI